MKGVAILSIVFAAGVAGRASADPKPGEVVEVEIAKDLKMKFCWIPAGTATLGSPESEKERRAEEDEHEFKTKGFWMGKYEVTQAEWTAIMGKNPSNFVPSERTIKSAGIKDTSRFPVEQISWNDCKEFVKKLNESAKLPPAIGKGKFGLPHEDEWEYACRGGKGNKQPFYFGGELNGTQANCKGSSPYGTTKMGPDVERTTEVGSYEKIAPHPWGLCDIHGNVWEWCENATNREQTQRALRGGAWYFFPLTCRSAFRSSLAPDGRRGSFDGVRVAILP